MGWNVGRARPDGWRITGVAGAHPVEVPGVTVRRCDLTRYADLKELFREVRPDAVLHAAALSDPNRCQQEPELSRRVNLEASVTLAGLCGDAGIPCVFTSTDLVFDGQQAPYAEDAAPCPVNRYGEHKMLAEIAMRERGPRLCVCRLPLMYGNPGPVAKSFLQPLAAALRAGRPAKLFTDEFRTPADARDVAVGLFLALDALPPLLHLGGPERLSRFEFGRLVAELVGAERTLVQGCRQTEVPMAAARPPDVALDSRRAFALGYAPAAPKAALPRLLKDAPA